MTENTEARKNENSKRLGCDDERRMSVVENFIESKCKKGCLWTIGKTLNVKEKTAGQAMRQEDRKIIKQT